MTFIEAVVRFPLSENERNIIFWATIVLGVIALVVDIIAFIKAQK